MGMGSGSINYRMFGVMLCQSSIGGGEQDIRKGYPYIYKGRMYIARALEADLSTLLTSARDSANPSLPPRGRPQGSKTGASPIGFHIRPFHSRAHPAPPKDRGCLHRPPDAAAQSLLYTEAPAKPTANRLGPACTGRRSFDGQHLAGLCIIGCPLHAVPLPRHEKQRLAIFATEHTGEASPV